METHLRGMMEIQLDSFLKQESLRTRIGYFSQLKNIGLFNSIEDAIVGALIASLTASCASIKLSSGLEVTGDDMQAIREICTNRSADIKSKISIASNL